MSEQANIETAKKLFAEINSHKLGQLNDLYHPTYKFEGPGAPGVLGVDQSQAYVQGFLDAFPDLHFDLERLFAQGEYAAVEWMATGTHTGPLRTPTGATLPPLGKKVKVPGANTYQFRDGKVIHGRTYWDMVTLLAQLGMMPGM
jgi:steroid delta-isomerase-like uncharacterized protein